MQQAATIPSAEISLPPHAPAGSHTCTQPAIILRHAMRFVGQCFLLWAIFDAAGRLVTAWRVPLPANLVGLLLLLLLLGTGIIQPDTLREATVLVTRHLSFLFVPLAVGVMAWPDLIATSGVVLALVLLGAVVVGIATAGVIGQLLIRRAS